MKQQLVLLLAILFINLSVLKAQEKKDTTILVQEIATLYLNTMYANKNFDSAYKMWDKGMFENLQSNAYPKSRGFIKDTARFIKEVKSKMQKYYKRIGNFKIIEFKSKYIIPTAPDMYMLNYLYSAEFDQKYQQNNSIITVDFNKKNRSWGINDERLVFIFMRIVSHSYNWKNLL